MSHSPLAASPIPNRPLAFNDILQAVLALYKRGFWTIILVAIAPSIISLIAMVTGLVLLIVPLLPALLNMGSYGPDWELLAAGIAGSLVLGLGTMLVGSFITMAAQIWAGATIAVAITHLDAGQRPTFGSLWRANRGLVGRSFALAGLLVALVLGATVALIVLMALAAARWGFLAWWSSGAVVLLVILVSGRLALTVPVLAIEQLAPMAALKRSWQLTEAHLWRVVGITLLVGVLISVGAQLVAGATNTLVGPVLDQLSYYYPGQNLGPILLTALPAIAVLSLLGTAYSVLTTPVQWMVNALLFIDLVRRPPVPPRRAQFGPKAAAGHPGSGQFGPPGGRR